jgi:hypothetical protein
VTVGPPRKRVIAASLLKITIGTGSPILPLAGLAIWVGAAPTVTELADQGIKNQANIEKKLEEKDNPYKDGSSLNDNGTVSEDGASFTDIKWEKFNINQAWNP